ncbi:MAG: anti-sigma factor [Acidithiobacillus sp.]|uniref:anti-sigma factor n=1 Tax=Acidithiobacillus sp. TaxID=1872118 RepID=UPI003D0209A5
MSVWNMELRKFPRLAELLAASYVLGTLQGRARLRFAHMLRQRPWLARIVARWEDALMPKALTGPARPAPASVWHAVQAQLPGHTGPARMTTAPAQSWWRASWWPALSAALTVALLVVWFWPTPPQMPYTAVLTNAQGKPTWVIRANAHDMRLRTLENVALPQGHSYQLWALVPHRKPISMGLLPTQPSESPILPAPDHIDMQSVELVAVTMEPAGGSPTGQPTGPILFKAYLVRS